ncbi:MAG: hypothetical protein QOF63_2485 [Thermoanaerobaculia bacterium]|jgi:hypothetical protein|nr:hypothetical protein [Thermoanaerobaculia bacterium]MEA2414159.1 hypothetical protein [Thermoanaerobaculia bacterium]
MEIQDRTWKEKLAAMPRSIKPRVKAMTLKTNDRMRGNPSKWAGIAAGAGLALGLAGRFLQRRASARHMPAVIIIEAAC